MREQVYFNLGKIAFLPLLPLLYFDGKRIKSSVPRLPEAQSPAGEVHVNDSEALDILLLGESTIAGVGVEKHEEGFNGTLAKELSILKNQTIRWKVYAKSGFNASKVRKRLLPTVTENSTKLCIIGLGGNDAFEVNSPKNWIRSIKKLILDIKAKYPDTPVVFCNMPPIKLFPAFTTSIKWSIGNLVNLLGDALAKEVKNHNNVYYNSQVISFENWAHLNDTNYQPSDFFSDGVHPSKLTYQLWGKEMAKFIVENKII